MKEKSKVELYEHLRRDERLDDLEAIGRGADAWWFGAPEAGTWPVARWRKRRFDRWAYTAGWPERDDYGHHSAADPAHQEANCPVHGQDRRRWRWNVHAWRHHAACYQLFELGLDPEDVANHLATETATRVGSPTSALVLAESYVSPPPRPRSEIPETVVSSPHRSEGDPHHNARTAP